MTDYELMKLFKTAWRGLGNNTKARTYYLSKLRKAKTLADGRFVVCKLCAEGGIDLDGVDATLAVWRELNDDWKRFRDLALFANASD